MKRKEDTIRKEGGEERRTQENRREKKRWQEKSKAVSGHYTTKGIPEHYGKMTKQGWEPRGRFDNASEQTHSCGCY